MPYKNKDKRLVEGERYHAYNRGYHHQKIFHDDQDYSMFMYLIKKYLDPTFTEKRFDHSTKRIVLAPVKTPLNDDVVLQAYCLMPNHFHLLVKLKTKYGMSKLLNIVCSSYSIYYNEKYGHEGLVWQGTYRAVHVGDFRQYLHLSRYIHLNPYPLFELECLSYAHSSYGNYLGNQISNWLDPTEVLEYFKGGEGNNASVSYREFVESFVTSGSSVCEEEERLLEDIKLEL